MDLDGQTAPETTRGFFDSVRTSTKKELPTDYKRHTEEIRTKPLVSDRTSVQHRSLLHPVCEEDTIVLRPQTALARGRHSTAFYTNVSYLARDGVQENKENKDDDDDDDDNNNGYIFMSREDVLAEAEAKLTGTFGNGNQQGSRPIKTTRPRSQYQSMGQSQHQRVAVDHYNGRDDDEDLYASPRPSSTRFPPPVQGNPHQYHHHHDDPTRSRNRRLSEPNARVYSFDTPQQNNERQRRSLNGSFQPQGYQNRRTSLQSWQPSRHGDPTDNEVQNANTLRDKPNLFVETSRTSYGSSGSRRSSRSDWRSSTLSLAPSNRSSMAWPPSTPTRFSFIREDGSSQQQRRALFTAHLPFSAVIPLLKSNQLVSGMLRINKRNRSDAYVYCQELDADIYICGSRDRNRALEGDVVAVRLVEVDKVMREKQEKELAKVARNHGQPIVRKPDEEDEKEIMFGGEEDVDRVKPKYCGVVVALIERTQTQLFSGTLGLVRPSSKRSKESQSGGGGGSGAEEDSPRIVWFKPTDKRVPLIAIPVEQAPPGFIDNGKQFENKLFLGSIKRWPITSLHPFGVLENELGAANDLRIQFRAIMADNNFSNDMFSESVKRCLPLLPWTPSEESIASRLDLRGLRCITMEYDGALDNAMSIRTASDNAYEVGFHVSDVSEFVQPHSPLDKEGRQRAVAICLFEGAPLWPAELLTHCTDFSAHAERFAFSVIWKLGPNGKVLDVWYGKTVIRSQGILSMQQIQSVLDGHPIAEHLGLSDKEGSEWEKDLSLLHSIAKSLRADRARNGALFVDEPQFDLDFGQDDIPRIKPRKPQTAAQVILDEFRHLVNTGVAQRISSHFPETALLQSQSAPNDRKLRELASYLRGLGYTVNPSTAGTLQQSIDRIENKAAKSVIIALVLKTLSTPTFFCTGNFDISRYHHYVSNAPLYTQFTSPSRHFADVIVHRQLEATLSGDKRFYLEGDSIQRVARHCNVKSQAANNARAQVYHLFLSRHLIISRQTTATHEAIVVGVHEQAFDVMVPELNLERRIHVISLPVKTSKYSPTDGVLHLYWKPGVATTDAMVEQQLEDNDTDDFDHVLVDDDDDDELVDDDAPDTNTPSESDGHQPVPVTESLAFKRRPRSMSLRAIQGENPWATQQECTIPDECRQVIRPFDYIRVVIESDVNRTPPLIRVLAANPFV